MDLILGVMMGMGIGGAMGSQIGGLMGNMTNTPPPPTENYHIALNGQQLGLFNLEQLKQFVLNGQFTANHYVWKEGMKGWELAGNIPETASLFTSVPPPPPSN